MKTNVVGAVSKPTPETLVQRYETFDSQCGEIRRQIKAGSMYTSSVQALIEHRPIFPETIDSQIMFWTGLYWVVFEIDAKADLLKLNWLEPDQDFWDMPMVKGLTETKALNEHKRWNKFPVGSYYDDPSAALDMEKHDRHPSRGTYGVRFHADPEGDKDQGNISANKHIELSTKGNTILEAQVLQTMYFLKSGGDRLNKNTVNHAIGSRFSVGLVPHADWYDKFCLGSGVHPGYADPYLRARVAVVTF